MAAILHAQSLTHSVNDIVAPIPTNGEFKLSLGSQIMTGNGLNKLTADMDIPLTPKNLINLNVAEKFKSENMSLGIDKVRNDRDVAGKYFPSTLTITTGYTSDKNTKIPPLEIKSSIKKWSIESKIERETLAKSPRKTVANSNNIRASRLSVGKLSENAKTKSAVNSKYYFEATYNFKPSLTGKLSFDSSIVNDSKTNEDLQLEGVVKANRNVLIKAGIKNEHHLEVKNNGKKRNTKVWTEFILKF